VPRNVKLGVGLAGLIAVACGLFAARSRLTATAVPAAPDPVPVTAAEVVRQDVPIVLEGLGTVQALYTATIRTQVTGTLEEVDFSEGEKVKHGAVLAQIDPRTFQAALDQANKHRCAGGSRNCRGPEQSLVSSELAAALARCLRPGMLRT
jgi:multidrug efflux system membrane fusion protein